MKNSIMKYTEEKHFKIMQNIENDYEAQQLNEFYNQEDNEAKKEKLKKIRDDYYSKKIIVSTKLKEKMKCNL